MPVTMMTAAKATRMSGQLSAIHSMADMLRAQWGEEVSPWVGTRRQGQSARLPWTMLRSMVRRGLFCCMRHRTAVLLLSGAGLIAACGGADDDVGAAADPSTTSTTAAAETTAPDATAPDATTPDATTPSTSEATTDESTASPEAETTTTVPETTTSLSSTTSSSTVAETVTVAPPPTESPTTPAPTTAPPPQAVLAADRVVPGQDWSPFASFDGVTLLHPSVRVERIGFHESNHDGARQLVPDPGAVSPLVLGSRNRGTGSHTAADIVVEPGTEIRSPVSGTVIRSGGYVLYCDHQDDFVVIEPDTRPGWELKVLHIDGVTVSAGDRVEAGITVLAPAATAFPFDSQVDEFTAEPSWPHVHVELVDPSIPDRPSTGGGC